MTSGTEFLIHSEQDSIDERLRFLVDCNRKSMREREHVAMTLVLVRESCHTVWIRSGPRIDRLIVVARDMDFVSAFADLIDNSPLKR